MHATSLFQSRSNSNTIIYSRNSAGALLDMETPRLLLPVVGRLPSREKTLLPIMSANWEENEEGVSLFSPAGCR